MSFEAIRAALEANDREAIAAQLDALESSMACKDATIALLRQDNEVLTDENMKLSEENNLVVDWFGQIEELEKTVAVKESEIVSLKVVENKVKADVSKVVRKLYAKVDSLKMDNAEQAVVIALAGDKDAKIAALEKKNSKSVAIIRNLNDENTTLKQRVNAAEALVRLAVVTGLVGNI
jgi:hypothetical protein